MPFDPDAYLAEKPQPFDPDAYLAEESAFDPDDYLAEGDSEVSESYTPVADRLDKAPELFTTQTITDDEIAEFSKHYSGVDPELLRDFVILRGGQQEYGEDATENVKESLLSWGGRALDVLPGGPAQFIYKKMQDDPNARKALDDLNQLIDRRRSYASDVADILVPGLGAAKVAGKVAKATSKAKKIASTLGSGAIVGGAEGGMRASEGEELLGGTVGAGLGLGLGALAAPFIKPGTKTLTSAKKSNNKVIDKLKKTKAGETLADAMKVAVNGVDDILGTVSTRMGNISPELKYRLREYDSNVLVKTSKALDEVKPFVEQLEATKDADKIALHLFNGEFDKAKKLMSPELSEQLTKKVIPLLNKTGKDLNEAGYAFNLRRDYFPREPKDYQKLREAIGKSKEGFLDTQLKIGARKMKKKVEDLTPEEEIKIINLAMRGFPKGSDGGKLKFTKARSLDMTDDLLPYYNNPTQSLVSYLTKSIRDIERRKFFGKAGNVDSAKMGGLDDLDIDISTGRLVNDLIKSGKVKSEDQKELVDLIQSRFKGEERALGKKAQLIRDLGYMSTIGNVMSSLIQLGDLGTTAYKTGLRNTLSSVFGKKSVTAIDLGISDVSQEMAANGATKTAKALNSILKGSGFKLVDRFGKNVFIEANLRNARKSLSNPKKKERLISEAKDIFGEESDQFLKDLESGNISENVKLYLFNKLADVQPISLSEMPKKYLDMEGGRLAYMLKSFTLKQLDVVRNDILKEWSTGNKREAMKNAILYTHFLGGAGASIQTVKSLMLGRDVSIEEFPEEVMWSTLGAAGLNEYTFDQYIRKGEIGLGVASYLLPPLPMAEIPIKLANEIGENNPDISPILRNIPGVGPIIYNWFGGGAEKYNERQRKKRNE